MQQPPVPSKTGVRVSLACVQCRSRHLRCDAAVPICARCRNEGSECTYLKSRRGGRARVRPSQSEPQGTSTLSLPSPSVNPSATISSPRAGNLEPVPSLLSDQSGSSSIDGSSFGGDDHAIASPGSASREPLLELYYTFFHPAQPCALPMHIMKQRVNKEIPGVKLLVLVMEYIGSLFAPKIDSAPLEIQVKNKIVEQQPYPNGFEVQALLLYSIAVYWNDEGLRARELLDDATKKALGLGMNMKGFADKNSGGDPVLAESWRRTWWQLYLTDGHFTSTDRAIVFATSQRNVVANVDLPCDDVDYNLGIIPSLRTLEEYDNQEFAMDENTCFSSFAYLIGLFRSFDQFVVGHERTSEENVKIMCMSVDASVAAWLSAVSKSKRKILREDGTLDEQLFKANMLVQVYTVEIHRYLSTLAYSPIEAVSSCAPPPPPERLAPVYYRDAHIHTTKILHAIERMTYMLTLPGRTAVHTPFTICKIATTTIAHLSACRHHFKDNQLKEARERIRVAMGALEIFAEVWPRGRKVIGEVKVVARELLGLGPVGSPGAPKPTQTGSLFNNQCPQIQNDSPDLQLLLFSAPDPIDFFDFENMGLEMGLGLPNTDMQNDPNPRTTFPFDLAGRY